MRLSNQYPSQLINDNQVTTLRKGCCRIHFDFVITETMTSSVNQPVPRYGMVNDTTALRATWRLVIKDRPCLDLAKYTLTHLNSNSWRFDCGYFDKIGSWRGHSVLLVNLGDLIGTIPFVNVTSFDVAANLNTIGSGLTAAWYDRLKTARCDIILLEVHMMSVFLCRLSSISYLYVTSSEK